MQNFSQISRTEHLPTRIAAVLSREISEGGLDTGSRLPTEQELSRTFGVSRSVVREAIAQLRNEGLIETRQGVGAFVVDPGRRLAIRIGTDALHDPQRFRSLFQLRVPLEIEAAGLAARHHDAEQLARLDATLEDMRGVHKWTDDGIAADLEFHRALAVATGNEYFLTFLGFVGERISTAINAARERAVLEEIVEVTIAEHAAIRDAVAARDVRGARAAMRAHILGAAHRLKLNLELYDEPG